MLHDRADATEMRVLLLRHAETSVPGRFHGAESDIGLSDWGHRQAVLVAEELAPLAPTALYGSAMRRARDTAGAIARACGLEVNVVEALHERRMGPLAGVLREEGIATYELAKARWSAGDLGHTHEGGESYLDIRNRVVPAFLKLAERHPAETIVVVAHGVVNRVLLTTLPVGYGPADFDRIGIANCGINDLRWDGVQWRALAINCAPESFARERPQTDSFRF